MIEVERERNHKPQRVEADRMRTGDRGELILLQSVKNAAPREVAIFAAGSWVSARPMA